MSLNGNSSAQKSTGVISCLILAVVMVQLDSTIVNISLPTIANHFNSSASVVSWCVLAYLLAVSITLLFFGTLCDLFGVKNIILAGYIIFTAFSLFCGISPNIYILIASRFFQGIGGAALTIGVFVFVPKYFPAFETGKIFGIITTAAALGTTLGTPIGGFITGMLSWHWIFLINIPLGLMAIYFVVKKIKNEAVLLKKEIKRLDFFGLFLYATTVSCFLYVLNKGTSYGWTSPYVLILFAVCVISFVLFIKYEKTAINPLLDFNLFKNKPFLFTILAGVLAYIFLAGCNFLMPFYLELVMGLKTSQSGLVLLFYSLPLMFVGPVAGKLSAKYGSTIFCATAMLIVALASLIFALLLELSSIYVVILCLSLFGAAFGAFNSPNHNFIKNLSSGSGYGVLFGTEQTIYRFSMALGVTIFEMIYSFGFSGTALNSLDKTTQNYQNILTEGFKNSFLAGSVLSITAMVFVLLATKHFYGKINLITR